MRCLLLEKDFSGKRRPFPAQGSNPTYMIVDLTIDGGNNGAYVMLSRVQKLEDLLILRPFKESILETRPSPALQAEIDRLEECAKSTAKLEAWPEDCIAVSS